MSVVLLGSTSGSITLQEPAVAGTTVLDLPATSGTLITTGTTGQVIASGALPIGSVLQVVNATYSTETSVSSSSLVDTGLTATITPKFSTSKILILVEHNGCGKQSSNTYIALYLNRSSTQLASFGGLAGYNNGTANNGIGGISISYLDSPATTSSTTYKTQFSSVSNTGFATFQWGDAVSTITLMEIAG